MSGTNDNGGGPPANVPALGQLLAAGIDDFLQQNPLPAQTTPSPGAGVEGSPTQSTSSPPGSLSARGSAQIGSQASFNSAGGPQAQNSGVAGGFSSGVGSPIGGLGMTAPPTLVVPDSLFSTQVDMTPMKRVLEGLALKVRALEAAQANLQEENTKLKNEVSTTTHKYEIAQEQLSAMFATVTSYNDELAELKATSLPKAEAQEKFEAFSQETSSLRESLLDLDNKKLDTHSSLLETRIREVADDSCNRFLLRREREQREWVSLQVTSVDTRVTSGMETTRATLTNQLSAIEENVAKKIEDLRAHVTKLESDIVSRGSLQEAVDRSLITKTEATERLLGDVKSQVLVEMDRVELNLKKFIKSLGIDWTTYQDTLKGATPAIHVDDDTDSIETHFSRELASLYQQKEMTTGWKAVRSANFQLLTHIPRLGRSQAAIAAGAASDETTLDFDSAKRKLEYNRDEKLKMIRRLREQHIQQHGTASTSLGGGRGMVHPVTKFFLSSQLFSDFRVMLVDQVVERISSTKQEVLDDIAMQVQRLQRDLKQKVTSQRAVELIQEFAAKTVTDELDKVAGSLRDLAANSVTKEELLNRLGTKADAVALEDKATVKALDEAESSLKEEIVTLGDVLMQRLSASFVGRLKDLDEMKLSKTDPMFVGVLSSVDSILNGVHPAVSVVSSAAAAAPVGVSTPRVQSTSPGSSHGVAAAPTPIVGIASGSKPATGVPAGGGTTGSNSAAPSIPTVSDPGRCLTCSRPADNNYPIAAPQAQRLPPGELQKVRESEMQTLQEVFHQSQLKRASVTGEAGSRPGSASRSQPTAATVDPTISRVSAGGRPIPKAGGSSKPTPGADESGFSLAEWAKSVDARHKHAPGGQPQLLTSDRGEVVVAEQMIITGARSAGSGTGNSQATSLTPTFPKSARGLPPHPVPQRPKTAR